MDNTFYKESPMAKNSPIGASPLHPGSHCSLPKNMALTRGFSKVQANEDIIHETRSQIESKLHTLSNPSHHQTHLTEFYNYSFMLPDLNAYSDEFREYLHHDLIEMAVSLSLTEAGHLNWWAMHQFEGVCRRLHPMVTTGDGNCLLHAASLAMWGLHDRYLILRKALHATLEAIGPQSALWRRWRCEQMQQNRKFGLILSEEEWCREWSALLKLSSYQPRISAASGQFSADMHDGVYFESLEEFHVFVLAHIIQRPIIIVSDTVLHDANGEPLAPIPFGGIYLPLECELEKCHRYPLVLTYDAAHFSALVLMDDEMDGGEFEPPFPVIPVTYANLEMLPVHFAVDPGDGCDWVRLQQNGVPELSRDQKLYLLQTYLNLVKVQVDDAAHVHLQHVSVLETSAAKKAAKVAENGSDGSKTSCNSKLRRFWSLFKRETQVQYLNGKGSEAERSSAGAAGGAASPSHKKLNSLFTKSNGKAKGHDGKKVQAYKSWNALVDKLNADTCVFGARLSVDKPPKYDTIVNNYIESARVRFDNLKLEQKQAHFARLQQRNGAMVNGGGGSVGVNGSNGTLTRQVYAANGSSLNNNYHIANDMKCEVSGCFNPVDLRYNSTFCRNCLMNHHNHNQMSQ